jgi:hypothetical protein
MKNRTAKFKNLNPVGFEASPINWPQNAILNSALQF